uniref:Terminal uridylyl transferase 4 n=1 Tax=Ursus americanus TaxID=9643 RepID=A0A452QDE1_URSAM
MEDSKTSTNENHEPKKNAWALSEESKAVKVLSNQTLKARNDKSIKEIGTSSPNKNSSKKNKQNDICIEKTEVKSCKVNAANIASPKDLGLVLRDQSHCKTKKSPNSPVKAEKVPVSQAKAEKLPKSPNSPVKTEKTLSLQATATEKALSSQRKMEKVPSSQMKSEKVPGSPAEPEKAPSLVLKENMRRTELQQIGKKIPSSFTSLDKVNIDVEGGKSALETAPRSQKQQACTDNTGDSDDSASGIEDISDDLSKMKNDDSNKENSSEMEYLENATVIDESALTPEQRLGLKQAEERLERDHIFRLEKRSPEYTNCRYLCKLCLIHIENIQGAHKHIKEKRHKKNILEKQEESELRSLPPPTPAHLAALSVAVIELAKEHGITDDDLRVRQEIVEEMSKVITTFLPVLYIDVESDFHAKVPVVVCKDRKSGLLCRVSAGNDMACLTTDLLAALGKLEPVFTPLVLAFRYWAKSPLTLGTPNQVSLGQLWLELLKFYTLDFALEEYVICVRIQDILTRENKNWPKRRIAIEDPFSVKRNVARSLNSQLVYEYVVERFRAAYRYFACPQRKGGNKSTVNSMKKEKGKISNKKPVKSENMASSCCILLGESTEKINAERGQPDKYDEMECTSQRCITEDDSLLVNELDLAELGQESCLSTGEGSELEPKSNKKQDDLAPSETCLKKELSQCNCIDYKSPDPDESVGTDCRSNIQTESSHQNVSTDTSATSCNCKATEDASDLNDDDNHPTQELYYVFDKFILTSGKPPTIVCSICKKDGHSKNDCPEDFRKIDLKPLPPMTNRFREILDLVCKRCFDELSPPFSEQHNREQILIGLEKFIQKEYDEKARLCLFGSSKNGFGFRDSDLDICMTLEGHENAEKLNCKEIIENLAKILKRHPGLRNILPITTAKVPIVKFEHRRSGLEGDISLYNTLRCDIGDASRGSLSSYAYILMVLYFLQQRKPPVIPVLQEIFDGKQIPQRMVDGWNAFFFDKTEELKKRLPSLGKNTETLGELWLGLLRFYTEEFDFKEYVISIRQKKLLTTFEKQWTSKCIAIEDPFDLNHNLGAGVSRKMTNFIMKAFINGRKLFGTPFYPLIGREAEYFFDSRVLTDGELAPNDRCCRVCGKIGHYMKDCPKRRRLKKKDSEEEKDGNEEEKDSRDLFRDPRDLRCFICGDAGHVRRECPEVKLARQRNSSVAAAQLVRSLVNAQQVAGSAQQQGDQSIRARQSSECSDSPSYSPQPQPFPQNSSQSAAITQSPSQPGSQPKLGPPQQGTQPPHQVQMPMYNFPQSPPAQYSPMHNMGLLPMHPLQIPAPSWPIHGPVIHSAPGSAPSNIGLNDPSIIFAQPAARPVAIPNSSHDGHWPRTVAPNSLVNNGTVGNSEPGFPGLNPPIPWEHAPRPHFPLVPASWPYGLHQNFMHQGNARFQPNKPFYTQDRCATRRCRERCPHPPRGNVSE